MRGYRVGILGPRTPFGQRVRKLLSEGELPVIEQYDRPFDEPYAYEGETQRLPRQTDVQ